MNYIITVSNFDSKKDIFYHKLKALCLEYDIIMDEIYRIEDLKEFYDCASGEDYF